MTKNKGLRNSLFSYQLIVAGCLTAQFTDVAQAKEQTEKWQMDVGAGLLAVDTPWRGYDIQTISLPYFNARKGRWRIGPKYGLVQYAFLEDTEFEASMGLSFRDDTYDSSLIFSDELSDDDVFTGYNDGKGELTFRAQLQYKQLFLRVAQDISNRSEGITLLGRYHLPIYGKGLGLQLSADLGVYWQDEKYTQYVYGISGENIAPEYGRYAYQPSSAVNPFSALNLTYVFDKHWSVQASYQVETLDSTIKESPLVGDSFKQQLTVFVNYRFEK
ncbi:MipA/OmpV family protein [Aestuariibacter sp. A3R04]|uniref:MipA/OmpV family protein n=1 Tax=Aestuariibacter sp. A3R04 TaxID=2841571 RepID=UPI001C08090A|nr:MipA/OmpV family protein [Aestuariibacter sp. A3R04]MBU3021630.1 MipA/OmpV family protein [Aestuariibacter sp. A3R04]